ncbi:RNA exonuclease [Zostera marina]|uniref:RNA exonuclease n=1 Tax=Zostera marina TaxID=29655 RepID=A0A0K9PB69_ZOSMR|nr:RNA exonuclease [Zostera marina]
MEKILEDVDKQTLVKLVKISQTNDLKGSYGGWKEFLDRFDGKFGNHISDPGKRAVVILKDFINSFSKEEHVKFFTKVIESFRNCDAVQKCIDSPVQKLVQLTLNHPAYELKYHLPSNNEEWVIIPKSNISKAMTSRSMIAVDCEMVQCESDTNSLVHVCAVDQNLEVKLDMLVKPKDAVVDYRTHITGITSNNLDGVTLSLRDAQKSLKRLLKHGSILVGHSLYNDLHALKMDCAPVIDTSYIFTFTDSVFKNPSLNNLCKSVLGIELRKEGEPHDCINDACAAMKLVLAKLEHGFNDPITLPKNDVPKADQTKLFLHRIPTHVHKDELQRLFPKKRGVVIEVNTKVGATVYSAFAKFKKTKHADKVFCDLKGIESKDCNGLSQKLVTLQLSSGQSVVFYLRKMSVSSRNDKRPPEEDDRECDASKRQKRRLQSH